MSFIENSKKRREAGEEGFTLLELIITVAVLGILVAIAVPATAWIQSWSRSVSYEASGKEMLKAFEARFVQAGGSFVTFDPTDPASGPQYGNANQLAVELAAEMIAEQGSAQVVEGEIVPVEDTPNGYWIGFTPGQTFHDDGSYTFNPCFYIFDAQMGRTVCHDGSTSFGPHYGNEEYM